jgi:hypothetical protein
MTEWLTQKAPYRECGFEAAVAARIGPEDFPAFHVITFWENLSDQEVAL